jgi:hypothetical protein
MAASRAEECRNDRIGNHSQLFLAEFAGIPASVERFAIESNPGFNKIIQPVALLATVYLVAVFLPGCRVFIQNPANGGCPPGVPDIVPDFAEGFKLSLRGKFEVLQITATRIPAKNSDFPSHAGRLPVKQNRLLLRRP